ncbi:MAG: hypothetical protein KGD59_03015 [Candidatus Heimdallarchaeota archaeon]|nr:hypothetical protein [Candidatus Heimdallarchaeota archaeon]
MLKRTVMSWFLIGLILGLNYPYLSASEQDSVLLPKMNALPDEGLKYSLQEVGQYRDRYGAPTDIAVRGELAFIASYWGGLLIFNVSNPQQPKLIGSYNEERITKKSETWNAFLTNGIEIVDDLVLLADGNNGLLLINVSEPTEPRLIGKYSRKISDVKAQDNLAYLICPGTRPINYGNVIQIVNISNAAQPVLISEIDYSLIGGYVWDICVIDKHVYACIGSDLVVIDATNSNQPEEIIRLDIGGASILSKFKDYIFAGNSSTIKIVNASTPTSPILISEISSEIGDIKSISVTNDTIFLADFSKPKIIALNITDVENPTQIGEIIDYSPIGNCWKTLAHMLTEQGEDILFCADYRLGLFCFNVTNKSQPELIGSFDTNCLAWALDVEGGYAYICSRREYPYYPSRLEIINITNTTNPTLVGKYDYLNDTIRDVKVSGGYAYLCLARNGLLILDVHDPTNPVVVGNYSNNFTVGFFYNLWYDAESQLCYLPHPYYDLLIINCSDPSQPTLLSTFETWQSFLLNNVFLENNVAYLTSFASPGEIAIVDISNPQQPVLLSQKKVGDVIDDIYVKEGRAYLTGLYDPLIILDVSDPTAPEKLGVFDNRWFYGQGVAVEGSFAYLAQYVGGLRVVDVSNPKKPFEVAAVRDHYRGVCLDVYVREGYIFIADGWDGLEIYQLVPPKISQRLMLILSILPSIVGIGIVTFIAIITIKRRKSSLISN